MVLLIYIASQILLLNGRERKDERIIVADRGSGGMVRTQSLYPAQDGRFHLNVGCVLSRGAGEREGQ
jgi:hypothetical protein